MTEKEINKQFMTKHEQFINDRNAYLRSLSSEGVKAYLEAEKNNDIATCAQISRDLESDVQIVDGDPTVISVNGQIMDHDEFDTWYNNRVKELINAKTAAANNTTAVGSGFFKEVGLPTAVAIPASALTEATASAVKTYLRKTYGYCLARGTTPTIQVTDRAVNVKDISWGRKLSTSELAELDANTADA